MKSSLIASPSWALRTSLVVVLLCFPLLIALGHAWSQQQKLMAISEQMQQKLQEHQRAARIINEKLRQQKKIKSISPTALQILTPIGAVLSDDVALLRLNSNSQKREVNLEVAAKTLPALLDFSARLQRIPVQVELQHHHSVKEKGTEWPIRAAVTLHFPKEDSQ